MKCNKHTIQVGSCVPNYMIFVRKSGEEYSITRARNKIQNNANSQNILMVLCGDSKSGNLIRLVFSSTITIKQF